MTNTKTRSIKTSKALMEHFNKTSKEKGFNFNSRIVYLMERDSKFNTLMKEHLKAAVDKFSKIDVPESKRKMYKAIAKPLKALVKDLI